MFSGLAFSIIAPVLARYAAMGISSAITAISAYAIAHWGVSSETVAGAAAGGVGLLGTLILVLRKNKDVDAVLSRFPVDQILQSIAESAKTGRQVSSIAVRDRRLAEAVPSPKVQAEGPSTQGIQL